MEIMTCVDFFSGLGGFSQAFFERDGWRVIRIDNDESFSHIPNTHIHDLMTVDFKTLNQLGANRPDILLMSPPCNCFSTMAIRHYWENGRPKNETCSFAIDLVKRALELKDLINPRYWVLENPIGMMKYVLGPAQYTTYWGAWYSEKDLIWPEVEGNRDLLPLKPTWLWGVLPTIDWPAKPKQYARISRAETDRQKGVQGVKNSAISALIPYRFSEALCLSIEQNRGGQMALEV